MSKILFVEFKLLFYFCDDEKTLIYFEDDYKLVRISKSQKD